MRNRGIILVTSLIMAVVVLMFVGAALILNQGGLAAAGSVEHSANAQRAAESGVHYALSQLRRDPAWRGDLNSITVNSPDLFVQEDNGNVIGLIRHPDGRQSQFRLRFNYQDGGPAADGLSDPAAAMRIDNQLVSVNNLTSGAAAPVPRADAANYSVDANSATALMLPAGAVCLVVEGRSGPAVSRANPGNPNPQLGATTRSVEAVYRLVGVGGPALDAASMAGGGFNAQLPSADKKVEVTSKDSSRVARLRSKGGVTVNGGSSSLNFVTDDGGEVTSAGGTLAANYDAAKTSVSAEVATDPFYEIAWADVRKATSSDDTMAAGTYVVWQDGSLHYYDMSYDDYVAFIEANPTDPGTPASLPAGVKFINGGKKELEISDDLYISPTANTDEFAFIPRSGAPEEPEVTGSTVLERIEAQSGFGAVWNAAVNAQISGGTVPGNLRIDGPNGEWVQATWNPWPSFSGNTADNRKTAARYVFDSSAFPGWTSSGTFTPVNTAVAAANAGVSTEPEGKIDLGAVTDSLTAADLKISLKGSNGNPVVLSSEGNMRLAGELKGDAASITTGGDLRLVGLGADFASSQEQGVNMYARGDIIFSTLRGSDMVGYDYKDVKLKGIIYTWGNFSAKMGSTSAKVAGKPWGKISVEGTLVAYGGQPGVDAPGSNGKGKIEVLGEEVKLKFDPSYLSGLSTQIPSGSPVELISWSNRL